MWTEAWPCYVNASQAADEVSAEPLSLVSTRDVSTLRDRVRALAKTHGFSSIRMTKVVTAASELGRNTVIHGGGGTATLRVLHSEHGRVGIHMRFEDKGPGIPDLDKAFEDGFTTGSGMGLGLSGTRRLLGELSVESVVGAGTVIEGTAWK